MAVLGSGVVYGERYVELAQVSDGIRGESVFVERSATGPGVGVAVGRCRRRSGGARRRTAVGVGATHGSLYWKAPVAVVEHPVTAEVTVTSTAVPTLTNVPGVPAGQSGGDAPLSGAETTTSVAETEVMAAVRVPRVTLVMLPRFAPKM